MILLFIFALLLLPLETRFVNSPLVHLSDALKLKCDALPYRTAYVGTRCYFAVTQEVKLENATDQCSSIFPGAKASGQSSPHVDPAAPSSVFRLMMLERSKFHVNKDSSGKTFKSSGAKQSICMFDSNYRCDQGDQSTVIPGKCLVSSDTKRNYLQAPKYCDRLGMELPAIGNDLENKMYKGMVGKSAVWLNNVYSGEIDRKWHRPKSYSRFYTCPPPKWQWVASTMYHHLCPHAYGVSSVIDQTGYWGVTVQGAVFDTVCVKDAENDFTEKKCIPLHKWDKDTERCEWTGPPDACVQVIETNANISQFVLLPNFPKATYIEHELQNPFSDTVSKIIIRRGCMYTGYAAHVWYTPRNEEIMTGNENLLYGVYPVPCYFTGDLPTGPDSMNRLQCFCDPTEATLGGHVPAPPADKKCIEHHEFNEATQSCEWTHDAKFCGEIRTLDGRKMMLEIPNWPKNKKYDVKHWTDKRAENFHMTVTEIVVRQHCWATLLRGDNIYSKKSLETAGYGKHQVMSFYNGLTDAATDGTMRVICECMR